MKTFKAVVLITGLLSTALLVTTALLPSELIIKKQITINTTNQIPFTLVNDLKQWKEWFLTFQIDHNTSFEFNYNTSQLPAELKWKSSNPTVGEGKVKIKYVKKMYEIEVILTLQNEKESVLKFYFDENLDKTNLSLEFRLQQTFFEKWFGFFLETIIAPTLENSLEKIKTISEYYGNKIYN